MNLEYFIVPAASYLIGAIPFGYLIGRLHGIDIRKVGSGNIGATNVTRTVGKVQGKICFFLDFFKGALPVALVNSVFTQDTANLALAAGLAVILGHIFPIYLKFRGGKGVATAAGVALALAPYPLLCALLVWLVTFLTTRYVSLASIVAAAALPVAAALFFGLGLPTPFPLGASTLIFFTLIALLAILRHVSNIKRLLNGTESRFGNSAEKGKRQ
ncbi:glycerol-3-phosphate 1-O-acyltransferase PlsY [uncultured Victivallis sp.]|uniref:glycerol-3-phosphate 1-O-acyltransferase PlsY n=1 Tax=uncultured Victivallis sp. TaxID=354118 RepID=UPI0025E910E0|nr:glycerol-3-phosphate 1-O-acyltransferase PlsY [uncultured Victivallis sp.]